MPESSASDIFLNSMLVAFQEAQTRYTDSVAAVVEAEIRRDEAKRLKDEAYSRLEEARAKYSSGALLNGGKSPTPQKQTLNNFMSNSSPKRQPTPTTPKRSPNKMALVKVEEDQNKKVEKSVDDNGKVEQSEKRHRHPAKPVPSSLLSPTSSHGTNTDRLTRSTPVKNERPTEKEEEKHNNFKSPAKESFKSPTKLKVIRSPKAGSARAPKIMRGIKPPLVEDIWDSSSSQPKLEPLPSPKRILEISKGRTRDWLDEHLNCDQIGLVRKFYQASFGTRTNQETNELSVSTLLLNDESCDLVKDTSEIQEFYIAKSANTNNNNNNNNNVPTLRDKAAFALAAPQKEPIALFFALRKGPGKGNIYYGGHWTVIFGEMIDPPQVIKGQPRLCLLKFEFVGVDQNVVKAMDDVE